MIKKILKLVSVVAFSAFITSSVSAAVMAHPNEYVVKLKPGAKSKAFFTNSKVKTIINKFKKIKVGGSHYYKIRTHSTVKSSLVKKLTNHPMVQTVYPSYLAQLPKTKRSKRLTLNQVSQVDMFDKLWGLDNGSNTHINAIKAWDIFEPSQKALVAVVDTGVDYNHADLKDQAWKNERELNGKPGVDDDGNGFVDDIYGYNFNSNSANPIDDDGHGTHCAGTIGASHDSLGVSGVARNLEIMAVKVLGADGTGAWVDVAAGITYAVDNGAQVINLSLGGRKKDLAVEEAIQHAYKKGVIVVVAAGNEGANFDIGQISYPAGLIELGVISVAAHDITGNLANFSNFGKKNVHVSAPGVGILSTAPGNKYQQLSGTSMAAPHVTGIVAEIISNNPNIVASNSSAKTLKVSPKLVRELLIKTSRKSSNLSNAVISSGMVDMAEAIIGTR